ncbi:hypothetical protein WEI85_19795 [Actinomycetes bacterium KLBMP 9797]
MITYLMVSGADAETVLLAAGDDPYEVIPALVRQMESAGRRPLRLDAGDWMTLADIGRRIGFSREMVRLWAVGQSGPGGFPPPLNPGCETRFYSWVEVHAWLFDRLGLPLADGGEPVLEAMNLTLQLRNLLPRLTRPEAILRLLRTAGSASTREGG